MSRKKQRKFNEDFLQFVWKFQLFEVHNLTTNDGQSITVMHPGIQNLGSGPDFNNARIKIGNSLWAGNVEVHYGLKEWYQHQHHEDPAYNNVVLHVVYLSKIDFVFTANQTPIPAISIANKIYPDTLHKYRKLLANHQQFIPCAHQVTTIDSFTINQFYPTLVLERLARKIEDINSLLRITNGSLDDAFLIVLFQFFGAPENKQPFANVAQSFVLNQVLKKMTSAMQLEALLFGLADLLHGQDEYACKLENEYLYLKQLYKLNSIVKKSNWKFARLRPPNFPTVRLAQLAILLFHHQHLFQLVVDKEPNELINLFEVQASPYWDTHYNFGFTSKFRIKKISKTFIHKLFINVVSPFLFLYGKMQNNEPMVQKSLDLLQQLPSENIGVMKEWRALGFPTEAAFDTQALLQLKSNYCDQKRCLHCRIGFRILDKSKK